jgi:hypothetical protein
MFNKSTQERKNMITYIYNKDSFENSVEVSNYLGVLKRLAKDFG